MPDGLSASVLDQAPEIPSAVGSVLASRAEKACIYLWLSALTCSLYFGSQRIELFEAQALTFSWLDRQIEFNPHWVWIYQTVYIVVPAVALSLRFRESLRWYCRTFYALLALCIVPFIVYPVDGPVRDALGVDWMYDFVRSYAGVRNCLPSLHVGMAVISVLFCDVVARERGLSPTSTRALSLGMTIWAAMLSYSTLAIKQHYAVDILAGIFVGFISYRFTSHAD